MLSLSSDRYVVDVKDENVKIFKDYKKIIFNKFKEKIGC